MKRLSLIFILAVFVAAGCSTKVDVGPSSGMRLEPGQAISVITPADGSYGNTNYPGSGAITASLLQRALSAKNPEVRIVQGSELQSALKSAARSGSRYAFHPQITNWEPRAAAWSGRPTRVAIVMAVYDLKNGSKVISQQSMDVRGRISTFISQSSEDVLKQLFEGYADQLL